jgi:glucose/arabinose dehydrogenase
MIARVSIFAAFLILVIFAVPKSGNAQPGEDAPAVPEAAILDAFPGKKFDLPTVVANAGDERLFVVEQAGKIWILKGEGSEAEKLPFLDITGLVEDGCEMGLLGLAFHPQYQQNGYFYIYYITDIEGALYARVARYKVSADPDVADADSEQILLQFTRYGSCIHNAGDLHFDPQGMLVISSGDGGYGLSQDTHNFLGKLLRIDVDNQDPGKNYAVPNDNPFLEQDALDELWMLGLRNAWRFSFDSLSGDVYIADVGLNRWEEVNYSPANESGGQNFGWPLKEGFDCNDPAENCDPGGLTDPVYVYAHENDICESITGGFVYRGQEMPSLWGVYVYADYCSGLISGLAKDGAGGWRGWPLVQGEQWITTFGEDNQGELYFAARQTGKIYRLQAAPRSLLPFI